jgi:hypothetical protein
VNPEGKPSVRRGDGAPPPKGILAGEREPLFRYLSEEVRLNMARHGSESAALWNAFYPFAHQGLSLRGWQRIRPLWGAASFSQDDDLLVPYFWGLSVDGTPLDGLADTAALVAGRDDRLEIDLLLMGARHLIAVEAKMEGEPGRCGRFDAGRCPEIHGGGDDCRYWEDGASSFESYLDFGARPRKGQEAQPPCVVHYQLARTLLAVVKLAAMRGLTPHLALLIPRRRWAARQAAWQDFAERVRDEEQWKRLSVVAWEDLTAITRRWCPVPKVRCRGGLGGDYKVGATAPIRSLSQVCR